MKDIKNLLIILLSILFLGCLPRNGQEESGKLEVFYLPFDAKIEAKLTLNELMDLDNSLISYYCTNSREEIQIFKKALDFDRFKVKDFDHISPYMLIVFTTDTGNRIEILVDDTIYIKNLEKVYRMDAEFREWTRYSLPKASLPEGTRVNNCS